MVSAARPRIGPGALDPQRKLSGEDATLQSVGGRCCRPERDERQDHPQIVRTELDPVDYRLEQIFSSIIGEQALPQALCFSQ
jgi:hypothetical protein